jgi:hypothetical protein
VNLAECVEARAARRPTAAFIFALNFLVLGTNLQTALIWRSASAHSRSSSPASIRSGKFTATRSPA